MFNIFYHWREQGNVFLVGVPDSICRFFRTSTSLQTAELYATREICLEGGCETLESSDTAIILHFVNVVVCFVCSCHGQYPLIWTSISVNVISAGRTLLRLLGLCGRKWGGVYLYIYSIFDTMDLNKHKYDCMSVCPNCFCCSQVARTRFKKAKVVCVGFICNN